MNKKIESLDDTKFKPLGAKTQDMVRGGQMTAGDSKMISYERGPGGRQRDYYKKWGSDEFDGKDVCYYEVTFYYSDWY